MVRNIKICKHRGHALIGYLVLASLIVVVCMPALSTLKDAVIINASHSAAELGYFNTLKHGLSKSHSDIETGVLQIDAR